MSARSLSAAQLAKIRRLAAPVEPDSGQGGELNVVPYLDIIMNLTMFVLVAVSVVFVSSVEASAAVQGGNGPRERPLALGLAVLIADQGISLKTTAGNVGPGCEGLGAGITLPRAAGEPHDLRGLAACARKLKALHPDERQVMLSASPGVDYQTVIASMDALRRDDAGDLFGDVRMAVVR